MNRIQGTKPSKRKWNQLLDEVVEIIKYNKSTIDHAIYIKVFSDVTVSYITVSNDVLNTTNNETSFTELTIVFEEYFGIKLLEGSVLKYLNFRTFQSPLGFSVFHTDHIMEIVNEFFPNRKFIKVDIPFRTYYEY